MLIDFHTHLFPDRIAEKTISYLSQKGGIPAYADGTLAGLQRALKEANVDLGINLPILTRPDSFDSVLSFAAQINEGYFKGEHDVLSFGCIHPDCEDVEEKMAKIKSMGFLGIKLHPDYQQTFFDDEKTIRILKAAEKEDLIVLTPAGYDGGYPELTHCTPRHILNV